MSDGCNGTQPPNTHTHTRPRYVHIIALTKAGHALRIMKNQINHNYPTNLIPYSFYSEGCQRMMSLGMGWKYYITNQVLSLWTQIRVCHFGGWAAPNIKTGIIDFRLNSRCAPRTGLVPLQRARFCNHAGSRQTTFTSQGHLLASSFYSLSLTSLYLFHE